VIARQRDSTELGREDPRANFNSANVSEETLEGEESWNWIGKDFLSTFWPELRDRGGLRSARWRARLSAAEFLSSLAEYDLDGEKSNTHLLSLLEELLQSLIFEMALVDSQWQVLKHFFQSYSLSHVRNYMTNGRV
jgi:ribosomal protein S4